LSFELSKAPIVAGLETNGTALRFRVTFSVRLSIGSIVEAKEGALIACHECDALYRRESLPVNAKTNCTRCVNLLYQQIPDAMNRCIALYLKALMLWFMANSFPFLSLKVGGLLEVNSL
tara:strand:- start:641 stop:997 length:357 start_codon:yes stop_codon:yes gene_type:complete